MTLPILGPPYLPLLARRYLRGFRQVGPVALYTTRGLGTTFLPIRFNSPPEITFLTYGLLQLRHAVRHLPKLLCEVFVLPHAVCGGLLSGAGLSVAFPIL